jgi:penicillin-binding protein 2
MYSFSTGKSQSWLSWFLRGILILLFLILFAKLFEVQIIKGEYYRTLSQDNRIRYISLPAPRGRILARGGEELATNVEVKKRVKFNSDGSIVLTDDLTGARADEIISDYKRVYPLGSEFAHAAGYLAVVSPSQVGTIDPNCPGKGPRTSGMLIGVTGLEDEYQCQLMGTPGEELVEVDTSGREVRILGRRDPVPGQDIKTTIDYGLQKEVAKDMGDKKGAAIITNLSGQILAFYSSPSFDPTNLVPSLNDPNLPLFDRVISGTFNPGSVFKPVVAIAALEEGVIDKNFLFNDPGVITVNNFSYRNWYYTEYGRVEGQINLVRAIARSTDTFFYTIGGMVGPDAIAKWADAFGLNKPTGVDLPGEAQGLIPTPGWKEAVKKESWYLGNTYHMAIGQGDVSVTPIELNTYIAAVADGGKICQPTFLLNSSPVCHQINVSQDNLNLVKEGMKEACATGGTGYTFFDFGQKHNGLLVACKTGTAEVGTSGTPNAWFTVFAPFDKPQVVATVVFEKGGEGSSVAGPVARKIMDYYSAQLTTE